MTREQAIQLIDRHKETLLNPADMVEWIWLRVIIKNISPEEWNYAQRVAAQALGQ